MILGTSKLLGYGRYKSLVAVLSEDLTESEKLDLYGRLWAKLQGFVTNPLNQTTLYAVVKSLSDKAKEDPEVLDNIKNEIRDSLNKKNMNVS